MKRDLIVALLKQLREKDLVDGVGMQSHWDMDYPTVDMLADALEKYGEIDGLEIQLTEVDMHNTDNSEEGLEKQAERYQQFFETIVRADRTGIANITNVTFWGITDEDTWLSGFKGETSYPLLFDENYEKKPCYDSVLATAKEDYE
jgi:endo-1,4-beta-xylanase